MRANRLPAARGLRWVAEAFVIFRVAPLRQLLLNLLFLFAVFLLLLPLSLSLLLRGLFLHQNPSRLW